MRKPACLAAALVRIASLCFIQHALSFGGVKEKWNIGMAAALMIVFALTRWPGLMPNNFSAAYALAFCAGVYFPGRCAWWLPLGTLLITDIAINLYYTLSAGFNAFQPYQLVNYVAYAVLILMGRSFGPNASLPKLISGGVLGSVSFYLITNSAAWLFNPFGNPEYTRTFGGWLTALTKGTSGYPETWQFFRNTFLSGGLFTALFAGAMWLSEPSLETEDESPVEPSGAAGAHEESKA
jgi:hypothetical protein